MKKQKTLKGYIVKTGLTLEPFGDPVSEAMIGNETLVSTQERALRGAGIQPVTIISPAELAPGPAVILFDRVYVSDKLMKDFVKTAPEGGTSVLGLGRCISVDFNIAIQDVIAEGDDVFYSCFLVHDASKFAGTTNAASLERALADSSTRLKVPMREMSATFRMPTLSRESKVMRFPITSSVAAHVVHWVTLLRLNTLQWGIRWMEQMRSDRIGTAAMSARAMLKAAAVNPYKILSGINVVGAGCSIHPTAYIEGSFLGDNVTVGAGATIRNSLVGSGAVIGDQGYLMNSVIGGDCFVTDGTALIWVMSYPGTSIGNIKMQMSLVGRDTYLGVWCSFLDAKFLGDVMVEHRGGLVSSGTSFLGSCIGHNCRMGGKVLIMPGRSIPNGTFMVTRPDESIVSIPEKLPAGIPLIRDNGTLVPLKKG
jgi:carbonic anhydrase/acetyltransferase-like protein (isoleucine patch superfamily)